MGSTRFSLNAIDWKKIGKGLAIAVAGAGLTYLTEAITGIDFGMYTAVVAAGWAVVANIVRKWIADNSQTP